MKTILGSFVLVIICNFCFAQITFQKTFGGANDEQANIVVQTPDGGYLLAGSTSSAGAGGSDVMLLRLNADGDSFWTRTFGGISEEIGNDIEETSDGGYIIGGYTNSNGSGNVDMLLIKTDNTGNLQWSKTYGGPNNQVCNTVHQLPDGGYILAGNSENFGAGNNDYYLVRTDSLGNFLWGKTYGHQSQDYCFEMQVTADNGFILAGQGWNSGNNVVDYLVIKTDSSGVMEWNKTYGGSTSDVCYAITTTPTGGFVALGSSTSFNFNLTGMYLVRGDDNGNQVWSEKLGHTHSEVGRSIFPYANGYIVAGYGSFTPQNNMDIYLARIDSNGNPLWCKAYGDTMLEYGYCVRSTSDGGFIIVGMTKSYGVSGWDVYIIKTDSIGNVGCHTSTPAVATLNTTSQTTITVPATSQGNGGAMNTPVITAGSAPGNSNILCTTVGLAPEMTQTDFEIFPNPTKGAIFLHLNKMQFVRVIVYDANGKQVRDYPNIHGEFLQMNLEDLTEGFYILKVIEKDGVKMKKFLLIR